MKTELQIVDQWYENAVYRLCTVLEGELVVTGNDPREAEEKFHAGLRKYRSIRNIAKALLKEIPE
jgi:hypothetical protein